MSDERQLFEQFEQGNIYLKNVESRVFYMFSAFHIFLYVYRGEIEEQAKNSGNCLFRNFHKEIIKYTWFVYTPYLTYIRFPSQYDIPANKLFSLNYSDTEYRPIRTWPSSSDKRKLQSSVSLPIRIIKTQCNTRRSYST